LINPVGLPARLGSGGRQRLVGRDHLARQRFRDPAQLLAIAIALEYRGPAPPLHRPAQLGRVEGLFAGDIELCPVFRQQRRMDVVRRRARSRWWPENFRRSGPGGSSW
jgi:hypothetical protein